MTGSGSMDAERAFTREARARRRAALTRALRRVPAQCRALPVFDLPRVSRAGAIAAPVAGVRPIPLCAIRGTLEPSRASLFDDAFRPAAPARRRWQSLWLAEQRGAVLPPISVVPIGDGYAVRDGHHRVSVARARGALAIDATIDG